MNPKTKQKKTDTREREKKKQQGMYEKHVRAC
jgi:hypothetical protein